MDVANWHITMKFTEEMKLFVDSHKLPLEKEVCASFILINLHYIAFMVDSGKTYGAEWEQNKTM